MTPIESMIASTLIVASIFDIKERRVHDLVWLASLAIILPTLILFYTASLWIVFVKIALLFPVLILFNLFEVMGEADEIALVFLMLDTSFLSAVYAIIFALVVAIMHYIYLSAKGLLGIRYITREQFEGGKWIKKEEKNGLVGVIYAVPAITYFAVGYCLYLLQSYIVLF